MQDRTTGQIGQFAPAWDIDTNPPIQPYSRGIVKTDITGQVSYDITEPLDNETADWLRFLRRSPEAYLLEAGQYIPITVEPSDAVVEVSRTGQQEVRFTLILGAENSQEL
jgi:hypothetical protein